MKNLKFLFPVILLFLVIGIESCKEDDDDVLPTPPTELAIGDFHEGGVIFYLDSTLTHGYVVSTTNQSYGCEWGCQPSVVTGANGLEVGTGTQNTLDIRSVCPSHLIAAAICNTLI